VETKYGASAIRAELPRATIGFFVAAMAAAAPPPFSHRLHLKLKLDCATCHTLVRGSTRVEDNNLPVKAVCLRCHKDATIPKPAPTLLARFDHQRHLKLGNIARVIAAAIDSKTYLSPPGDIRRHLNTTNPCIACHRGLEESDAVGKSAMPQMADCLVCHAKIDPPYSCEFCHSPGAKLKPANHTPDFLDSHTSPKAKLDKPSCAVCHGRRFTCLGCH